MDFKDVLEAVDTALGVIEKVGSIPGVDLIPYVSTVKAVAGYAHTAITLGKDIAPVIEDFTRTFSSGGQPPTPEEVAALNARIAAKRAELHAPMPPREGDEPE